MKITVSRVKTERAYFLYELRWYRVITSLDGRFFIYKEE